MNLLNPYTYVGGALVVVLIGSTIAYQNNRIHHYHAMYDCVESGTSCPKGTVNIPELQATIKSMTEAQNTQTGKSDENVIKVIQIPQKVQPIINEIRTAPASGPCVPPTYPDEVKNAF